MKHVVSVIGSGNWGTAISKLLAENVKEKQDFADTIYMWTFEEKIQNRNLTEIINSDHENVKYLPNIKLPDNVYAEPDIHKCIQQSDILVFVTPHQFVKNIINDIKSTVKESGRKYTVVSLVKGVIYENNKLTLISKYISNNLGVNCSVLMGANIATQVAQNCVSEGTLACLDDHETHLLLNLFNCYTYRVSHVKDICAVELCGTLKNIVSIGYGIGVGKKYPSNTTVAILRNGLKEIVKFVKMFYSCELETFFESAGIADLIVSCLNGRNFKCGYDLASNMTILDIEDQMNGQKLQGTLTSKEIHCFLKNAGKCDEYPLFTTVYKICYENEMCDAILEVISYELGKSK